MVEDYHISYTTQNKCILLQRHLHVYSCLFAALFTIVRKQNQSRYPLTDEWIVKLLYAHTMTFYSAMKKKENKE